MINNNLYETAYKILKIFHFIFMKPSLTQLLQIMQIIALIVQIYALILKLKSFENGNSKDLKTNYNIYQNFKCDRFYNHTIEISNFCPLINLKPDKFEKLKTKKLYFNK